MISIYVPIKPLNGDMREGDAVLQRVVNGILNSVFNLYIPDELLERSDINAWDYLDDRIKPYLNMGKMGANHYLFFDKILFKESGEEALAYLRDLKDGQSKFKFRIGEQNKNKIISLAETATAWIKVKDSSINGNAFGGDRDNPAEILAVGNSPDTKKLEHYNRINQSSEGGSTRIDRKPDYTKIADQVTDSYYFEELLKTPGLKAFFGYFWSTYQGKAQIIDSSKPFENFLVNFVLSSDLRERDASNPLLYKLKYKSYKKIINQLLYTSNLDGENKKQFHKITAEIILAVEEFCGSDEGSGYEKSSIIYALLLFLIKGRNEKYYTYIEETLNSNLCNWSDRSKKSARILLASLSNLANGFYGTERTPAKKTEMVVKREESVMPVDVRLVMIQGRGYFKTQYHLDLYLIY